MFKKVGSILALVLGGILLVYSATRSLDFIELTLPPDRAILAWFGLAALDGGLVSWLVVYLRGARGWQRAVSFLMIIVDLVGAVTMFTLDTLYNTGKAGLTVTFTPEEMEMAVLALSGVIAINIAATVAYHMVDPDELREQAHEEAFSKVEDATLKQISRNADNLASQLAPTLAADWMAQTQARYMAGVGTNRVGQIIDLPPQAVSNIPVSFPSPSPVPEKKDNAGAGVFTWLMSLGRKPQAAAVAAAVQPEPTAKQDQTDPLPEWARSAMPSMEDQMTEQKNKVQPVEIGIVPPLLADESAFDIILRDANRAAHEGKMDEARDLFEAAYNKASGRGERERVFNTMVFCKMIRENTHFVDQSFRLYV